MMYFKIYPIIKSNFKGFHFKIPTNITWRAVLLMYKLLYEDEGLLQHGLYAGPVAAAGGSTHGGAHLVMPLPQVLLFLF